MEFTKMHGCGNDYIYIDCRDGMPENVSELAVRLSDRHKGVGGDGIILICHSDNADFLMRIFNADGSEGRMCGNGIRCVAKYVFDKGMTDKHHLEIDTLSGVKIIDIAQEAKPGDEETWVTVDMGKPEIESLDETIELPDGSLLTGSVISMGNPHFVCFSEEYPSDEKVIVKGPMAEKHQRFPDRSNIEFARLIRQNEVEMRVWERGSGETMACGTGACATAVAAISKGLTDNEVTVHLRGGDLRISLDARGHVLMTGPAATVFEGII
ncbi:MAG: diaminopimelate epimerase, partial [Muribaculaceae bacterium]|nr:diaminopimelate epimerase [Muribaculaceae bacterium]